VQLDVADLERVALAVLGQLARKGRDALDKVIGDLQERVLRLWVNLFTRIHLPHQVLNLALFQQPL